MSTWLLLIPTTMVNHRIPDAAKCIALKLLHKFPNLPLTDILEICDMSIDTFRCAWRRHPLSGSVAKAKAIGRGRPRILSKVDAIYLLNLARHTPTTFLDEYAGLLRDHHYLPASFSTVHRTFERAGLSVKRVQKLARERSPQKQAAFIHHIAEYPPRLSGFSR